MFGRNAHLPIDVMFPTEKPDELNYGEYAKELKSTLEKAFHTVRSHVGEKQEYQKQFYDKGSLCNQLILYSYTPKLCLEEGQGNYTIPGQDHGE